MTVREVSKKFTQLPRWRKQMNTNRRQIQAAKEKRVHSDVYIAQVVETRVCNNPSRGVAFTRPKPTDLFLSIVPTMAFENVMG